MVRLFDEKWIFSLFLWFSIRYKIELKTVIICVLSDFRYENHLFRYKNFSVKSSGTNTAILGTKNYEDRSSLLKVLETGSSISVRKMVFEFFQDLKWEGLMRCERWTCNRKSNSTIRVFKEVRMSLEWSVLFWV